MQIKKTTLTAIALMGIASAASAQTDSVKAGLRRFTARNFSEERTLNLYWETAPSHDYTLKQNGDVLEKGRMRNEHTIKFTTVIQIVDTRRFTLNARGYANFYKFDTEQPSAFMKSDEDDTYSYYRGELSASYIFTVGARPLIVRGAVSYDGYNGGWGRVDGSLTALYMFRNKEHETLGVGLSGMALFNRIPVLPIVIYSRQFSPTWRIDITLPSRMHLRCQFADRHRLSLGCLLSSDIFYCKPYYGNPPKTALYRNTTVKGELAYEYIVSRHFYFIARGGVSKPIKSGYYKTSRKGDGDGNPLIEYSTSLTPFFYLGFSYNLFK